jgi:hypothetical protein
VLADEPPWLIAALCGLQAWPWAAEVRSRMGLPPTPPALRDSAGRPAFRAALVEQVAARLPRTNGSNGHSHHAVLRDAAGGWRAIWPRMKQWLP